MVTIAAQPNPLIQSLQLAGANWVWPGDTLSPFWRSTVDTMALAGWEGYSNPWQWRDVRAAHLSRLGACCPENNASDFRLESCIAVWLHDNSGTLASPSSQKALLDVYLLRVDALCEDEESALLWAAIMEFETLHPEHPLSEGLLRWRQACANSMRWVQAHQIVYAFGLDLWPTARHMHRIVHTTTIAECIDLEGLLA